MKFNTDRIHARMHVLPHRDAPGAVHVVDMGDGTAVDHDRTDSIDPFTYEIDVGEAQNILSEFEGMVEPVVLFKNREHRVFVSALIGVGNCAGFQQRAEHRARHGHRELLRVPSGFLQCPFAV